MAPSYVVVRWIAIVALACGCGADLLNNQGIHAHVDELGASAQPIGHGVLSVELMIPIWGTYDLDRRVYGSPRPSGIIFDWILGGLVPLGLAGASFVVDDAHTRSILRWTALGLYGATRIGVETIGNLHINEYDSYLQQKTP